MLRYRVPRMQLRAVVLIFIFLLVAAIPALAGPADPYIRRGIAHYNAKRYSEALAEFQSAVRVEPRNDEAWAWLGITYTALGRNQEALAALRRSIELNPDGRQAANAKRWIDRLMPRGPTVVYLADLRAVVGERRFGQAQLFGKDYYKAMATYTRDSGEVTVYNLGGQYSRFRALVGMADNYEFYNGTPVVFRVQGDGQLLYESQPARSGDVPQEVDVSVRGVTRLELISIAPYGPLAIWADPRLIKEP